MASLFDNLPAAASVPVVAASSEPVNVFDQAVLLSLELRFFGTSRRLSNSEFEVDADKSKVSAGKKLLKSDELKALSKFDSETRRLIALYTLPSKFRAGLYLLPIDAIESVDAILRERQEARANLVESFCAAYENLKWKDSLPADQGGLGSCYHERDYPPVSEVRGSFSMSYSYTEFSAPGRLRGISMALYEREKNKAQEVWRSAIDEGRALLRASFAEIVDHMVDRLSPDGSGKAKIFKDSMVKSAVEFLSTFDMRTIGADAELKALVDQAANLLKGVGAADLRKDDAVRNHVAAGVQAIKQALSGMVGVAPARKLALDDEWGAL